MRTLPIALLPLLAVAAVAQDRPATLAGVYRVHKLTLVSSDLPRTERGRIVRAFQGGSYNVDELSERVRFKLRDKGYELVEVGAPQITRVRPAQSACEADVRFAVRTGNQYRLGGITFTGDSVFPSDQLRSQFHVDDGEIFNATEISKGLENLKEFYGAAGYANFGAIPKPIYDNSRHTISLDVDIDRGFLVTFGKLFMEGIEPRAGAAQDLLASWRELEGKRYNPHLIKEWLKRNSASWPGAAADQAYISLIYAGSPSVSNV
ncbi:MAG: POTRA domain-containing protein, partial [Terracidiphilus sp.]